MPRFRQVSIIGVGLIGGSLGMALRKGCLARRVIGFSRSGKTIRRALAQRAVNDGDTELRPNWLEESDLVVLAVPPDEVVRLARRVIRLTRHSFLMTDVTSVKEPITRALEEILPRRIRFVGSHPMAGSERSGIGAADAELFRGAACVVTRTAQTNPAALQEVSRMWRQVGGRVFVMDPKRHDVLVAQVSHAPHLTAVALTLLPEPSALPLAGGGFLDTTRIALSDPEMWDQICRMNRRQVLTALSRLIKGLNGLKNLVRRNPEELKRKLNKAAGRRRRVPA